MISRRQAVKNSAAVTGMLLAAGMLPQMAFAFNKAAFDAKTVADVMKAMGAGAPTESKDVTLTAPDIAENGAAVSLGCATRLEGVHRLLLLVERNPAALCALFEVDPALEPDVVIRTRMAESSPVWAVALMDDGRVLYARKTVEVTLGGCGG